MWGVRPQSKFGPPKAMCYQTQRYAMYSGHRLMFETDQVQQWPPWRTVPVLPSPAAGWCQHAPHLSSSTPAVPASSGDRGALYGL